MNKVLKLKILEYIILFTIIISIFVIYLFAKEVLSDKPELSTSYETKNYSLTKITKYSKDLNSISIYKIPFIELVALERSEYNTYIISTDNIIGSISEEITIYYQELSDENKNQIINYCNSYDRIESSYRLQCRLKNNMIKLSNNFNLNELKTNTIKVNNLEINIPIEKNTRLDIYLKNLTEQGISYSEVDKIK